MVASTVTDGAGRRVKVLGFPVQVIDVETAARSVKTVLSSAKQGRLRVVTLNPEMLMAGLNDPELGRALSGADLVVPDGIGIVWALRRAGYPQRQRVTGVELVETILTQLAAGGLRVFLLGGKPGVAETAKANLERRWPGIQVVGCGHGYFSPTENEEVVRRINQARPALLLVGMGVPRQEIWLYNQWGNLTVPVGIGVGGLLDLWAGRTKRAPAFLRRMGLEWLYRAWREPARWYRLRVLPGFIWKVWAEQRGGKKEVNREETGWRG